MTNSSTQATLSDLWSWNGTHWAWLTGSSVSTRPIYGPRGVSSPSYTPGARRLSSCIFDSSGLFLFGGASGDVYYDDVWKYSSSNWAWIAGSNGNNSIGNSSSPSSRMNAAFWMDTNKAFWMFGGFGFNLNNLTGVLGDLWAFSTTSLQWSYYGASLDGVSTIVYPNSYSISNLPAARNFGAVCSSADKHLTYIYGGAGSSNHYSDLWVASQVFNYSKLLDFYSLIFRCFCNLE